ncbi:MAG TPA: pirin family protein [Alphaproteobacteria bacterium]|nr:pirin family protein [Alphaproteobacteria bacterium]
MSDVARTASGGGAPARAVETVLVPKARDLGDFEVRRALPSIERRMVGPFVFWDHFGPVTLSPGKGLDVRPHPHIGLATVTYLFEGEIVHKDTLGNDATIKPGAVNWMSAGRGIAHSERSDPKLRPAGPRLFGLQSWVGLPKRHEESAPSFVHYARDALPEIEGEGVAARLVVGSAFGKRSPVATFMETLYADVTLSPGARLAIPPEHEERALYIVEGSVEIEGESYPAGRMVVLRPGSSVDVAAPGGGHFVLLGGEPMDGPRHVWWNFVSSSSERIEQAKRDWQEGRFGTIPGDDKEFIPLPK